ncbi:MAG TPA: hypothetical protein VD884_15100 [Ohtaekwangia sp.]|nr:hypothetical protein [Ohtaekwangia sp.]
MKIEGINNDKNSQKRDSRQSKFRHWIYFENGKNFPGYSKTFGWDEKRAAQDNLINLILRIGCDNQYLVRGGVTKSGVKLDALDKITYSINKSTDKEVPDWHDFLQLNYDYPEWLDSRYQEPKIVHFLAQLYDKLKRKVEPCAIFNDLYIKTKAPRIDPLSTETKRFYTVMDLDAHCYKLRCQKTYSEDDIEGFRLKYTAKYFSKK